MPVGFIGYRSMGEPEDPVEVSNRERTHGAKQFKKKRKREKLAVKSRKNNR